MEMPAEGYLNTAFGDTSGKCGWNSIAFKNWKKESDLKKPLSKPVGVPGGSATCWLLAPDSPNDIQRGIQMQVEEVQRFCPQEAVAEIFHSGGSCGMLRCVPVLISDAGDED